MILTTHQEQLLTNKLDLRNFGNHLSKSDHRFLKHLILSSH